MTKQSWKPTTLLNPVPVVMVSCADTQGKPNIITVAWTGTINSDPPMLSISVRKERHSHRIIKETGEFVVNLTNERLAFATDFCGVKSGKSVDKFETMKLTPVKSTKIKAPGIMESPVNIECKVKDVISLGTHDMFIAEILAVNVDEDLLDEKGKLHLDKAGLIVYSHGEYWSLKKSLGYFGFSVTKKKNARKRR